MSSKTCVGHDPYRRRVGELEKEVEIMAERLRKLESVADAAKVLMLGPFWIGTESTNRNLFELERALSELKE